MKRNHARQALNDKIHVVFFAALTILVQVFIQISIADVNLCSSRTSFLYGIFLSTGCVPHSASQLISNL